MKKSFLAILLIAAVAAFGLIFAACEETPVTDGGNLPVIESPSKDVDDYDSDNGGENSDGRTGDTTSPPEPPTPPVPQEPETPEPPVEEVYDEQAEEEWLNGFLSMTAGLEMPYIGENGNWFVQNADTGVMAQGRSFYETYLKFHPEYEGTEAEWFDDYISGNFVNYIVDFNSMGGSAVASIENVKRGDKIARPKTPSYESYVAEFAGWYKEKECINEWDFEWDRVDGFTVLYAKWVYMPVYASQTDETTCSVGLLDYDAESIVIPEKINGLIVTEIMPYGFSFSLELKEITIPKTVAKISESAFSDCENLERVILEDANALEEIGYGAFSLCPLLDNIDGLLSVEKLGYDVFAGSFIKNINIPNDMPGTVESIFAGLYGCENITVDEGNAAYRAEDNCLIRNGDEALVLAGINVTEIPDGVKYINVDFGVNDDITELVIPDGVISIGQSAFSSWSALTYLQIPSTLEEIGVSAFAGCRSLESVDLKNVSTILYAAFAGCTNLKNVTVSDWLEIVDSSAFKNCTSLESFDFGMVSNYYFDGIGMSTFENCTSLKYVVLPENLDNIGQNAFKGCTALTEVYYAGSAFKWVPIGAGNELMTNASLYLYSETEVLYDRYWHYVDGKPAAWPVYFSFTLMNGGEDYGVSAAPLKREELSGEIFIPEAYNGKIVTEIRDNSFLGAKNITSVIIPKSIQNIGVNAFMNAVALKTVVLEENIKSIKTGAFKDCTSLESVFYCGTDFSSITVGALNEVLSPEKIYLYSAAPNLDGKHWHYVDGKPQIWA